MTLPIKVRTTIVMYNCCPFAQINQQSGSPICQENKDNRPLIRHVIAPSKLVQNEM